MKLSVIIPVYNEETTLAEIIRRVRATGLAHEIIAVDDGSTDSSPQILADLQSNGAPPLTILSHERNQGKGAAVRTGLTAVTGDLVLVQDADLEYDPPDYSTLLAPFADPTVEVVYGSRNLRRNPRSSFAFYWGGRLLSWIANWLYGAHITDEATGYKVFRTHLLREIGLESNGFEFCPEVTAKLLQRGAVIQEVPISYTPRSWKEGKKIQWYDGLIAIWTLIKYRFFHRGNVARLGASRRHLRQQWAMIGIILFAMLLRLPSLGAQSIAFDESYSLVVGQANWHILFQAILSDGVHPPLFYILHKGALALWGISEFGQRFSAAVFSILSLALGYKTGQVLLNRRVGLFAALLLALNPLHVWLAQEARMYSLLGVLTIISMMAFWQAIHTNRRRAWITLTAVNSIIFVLHYFGFLMPAIQFIFIVLTFRRNHRHLRVWSMVQFIAAIPLLPWLIATASREVQTFGIGFLVRPTALDLPFTFWNLAVGSSNLFWPASVLAITVSGVALINALRPINPHKEAQLLTGLWALLPPVITWLVSQRRSFYADRYLSFVIPGLILLFAFGATRVARSPWPVLLIGGLVAASGYGLLATHLDPAFKKDNWRGAASYIAQNERPGDVVLLYTTHIRLSFGYYYQGSAPQKPISLNLEQFPIEPLTEGHRRAWVVYPYTRRPTHYPMQPLMPDGYWDDDPARNPLLVEWLQARANNVLEYRHFRGIEIWLIDLTAGR
jgi:dolichol-phosphate mannosyltransferase